MDIYIIRSSEQKEEEKHNERNSKHEHIFYMLVRIGKWQSYYWNLRYSLINSKIPRIQIRYDYSTVSPPSTPFGKLRSHSLYASKNRFIGVGKNIDSFRFHFFNSLKYCTNTPLCQLYPIVTIMG